jgi:hypothetical protein
MAKQTLTLKVQAYSCEECSAKQGTLVQELVRMIPMSVVAFGKLIGDEYFCCAICFKPKFHAKTRKPVKDDVASRPQEDRPGTRPLRVV